MIAKNSKKSPLVGLTEEAQKREWIRTDKEFRIRLFEHDFVAFLIYHYGWELTDFQEEWATSMEQGYNVILKAFRNSRKTTICRAYAVWCIVYKKRKYIVVQSFEDTLSGAWVHQVAKMLVDITIVEDYGMLFPLESKKEDLAKKSVTNFEAVNGVKIESKSVNQTIRGANNYQKGKGAARPDLLFLDDIDVSKSVENVDIVEKTTRKVKGETIGAMEALNRQIIFSYNVINEDGVGPRLWKDYYGQHNWRCYHQPLFDPETGKNVWPEVFTEDIIANLKSDEGLIGWSQNYLLIPYMSGQTIIWRQYIKTVDRYPKMARIVMGIDPSFSTKDGSDPIGICITAHHNDTKYVLFACELVGESKSEHVYIPFMQELYKSFKISMVRIEGNNGGLIVSRELKKKGMAVEVVTADRDKVTRLREKEYMFTRGEVFFLPKTEELQDRLVRFPNVKHDDIVDALVYSLEAGFSVIIAGV